MVIKKNPQIILKMLEWINYMLAFSRDPIEITTKLWSGQPEEMSEVYLNRSFISKAIRRSHIKTGRRGRDGEWVSPKPLCGGG